MTPRKITEELSRHIVGQDDAKKAVAIALRNRYRRKMVPENLREEIVPKNILMIGPTGVGKTEIARRLAKLANAPFLKIEATKFTEVGYVGRDVESIIRDLVEVAIFMVKEKKRKEVKEKAQKLAEERILDALVGESAKEETREKFREMLRQGKLDDKEVELTIQDSSNSQMPTIDIPGMPGSQMGVINVGDILGKAFGGDRKKKAKMKVSESHELLLNEESDKIIDSDQISKEAVELCENDGVVFLDEIDKIAAKEEGRSGGQVSREGVQRDLLPLIEGSVVMTKHGAVKTDHILFIASGAFHVAKPSDLLPELQGRLPIRVNLKDLSKNDMIRILKEPEANLLKQYAALMATEEVTIEFSDDGIEKIAEIVTKINEEIENIGARRLHTVMEKLLEDISFNASEMRNARVEINAAYVESQLAEFISDKLDLAKFIL